jgi:chromosomal replication initiator protein
MTYKTRSSLESYRIARAKKLSKNRIKPVYISGKKIYSFGWICHIMEKYTGLKINDLKKRTRKREIVEMRQIGMFLTHLYVNMSIVDIGIEWGDFDHSTVLHACKTVNNLIDTDKKFKDKVGEIDKLITA